MNERLSILIWEPDETIRASMRAWLTGVGDMVSEYAPNSSVGGIGPADVVLFGLGPDPAHDLRAMAAIQAAGPRARIVVLHGSDQEPAVLEALHHGARGHLCREELRAEDLVAAVRLVARGEALISPRIAGLMVDAVREKRPWPGPLAPVDGPNAGASTGIASSRE